MFNIKLVLKLVFSLFILIVFINITNFKDVFFGLKSLGLLWGLLFFTFHILTIVLNSQKIKFVFKFFSLNNSFFYYFKKTIISSFFNNFSLGTLGGDIYKSITFSSTFNKQKESIYAVIFDRLIGLLVLFLLVLIFLPFIINEYFDINTFLIALFYAIILVALVYSKILINFMFDCILYILRVFNINKLIGPIANLIYIKVPKNIFLYTIFLSLLNHMVTILYFTTIFYWLNLKIPFIFILVSISVINLLLMIPITYQGIGLREFLFLYFFGIYGITSSEVAIISLIGYLNLFIASSIGYFLYSLENLFSKGLFGKS